MPNQWRQIARDIKHIGDLPTELARLRSFEQFVPLGHYYSPETAPEDIAANADELFPPAPRDLPGLDLRNEHQLALLDQIAPLSREVDFPTHRDPADNGFRYWFDNQVFLRPDALVLAGMLRRFTPQRVTEIGSGFSSAVMLDVRERFLVPAGKPCRLTFIEPFPADRLDALLRPADRATAQIHEQFVQQIPDSVFDQLEPGDFLFIDSSHISKIGSDVNHLFFNILPRLKPGVIVHVHDIFAAFDYPRHWLEAGRRWNEGYLLRAFLQFNAAFEIMIFNNYLGTHERARFAAALGSGLGLDAATPPPRPEDLGASIWLRKSC